MAAAKYPLPAFLKGRCTEQAYRRWLSRKARTHVKRDRGRENSSATIEEYKLAIHEAVGKSRGKDEYTGEDLDWQLISEYNNEESKKGRRVYKKKFARLPTVDHVGDGTGPANFVIWGWRTNDCKNDLSRQEFIEFCRAVLVHCESILITQRMPTPSNWYEDFFHGVTLDLWRKAIPPEMTRAEAEFLLKNLGCEAGARVLDIPCGNGRLSFELAQRGYRVTGVDLAEEFIDEARASIQSIVIDPPATAGGTDISALLDFVLGDMRRVEGQGVYDAAYCFGNSFGFMEYTDMEKFLSGVARALKPNKRFIIETGMAAESVLPDFEEQSCHEIGDIVMTIKERYNAEESCVDSEYIFERNGKTESRKAKHWIYTAAEIQRMLEHAGFEVLNCYGSLELEPYKLGLRELYIIGQTR